ncbi:hypothetical protein [Winogradskyella sp.]|uniref:hypothetical protein n=1 Tax=Winogradskyella sp. TaxID=1883156 RepID=UPI00261E158C|nr:hypothetical protein [Winogradskyella sp.]
MKFLEKINNITMKVAKGMVAIFVIKLTLFLAVFTFNACSSDKVDISDNNNAEFNNAIQNTFVMTGNINVNNSLNSVAKTLQLSEDYKTIYLLNNDNQVFDNTDFLISINNLHDIVEVSNQHGLVSTEAVEVNDNPMATFNVQQKPIIDALQPSIQEAKNYFYSKGFNNADIYEMLDGEEDYTLIPIVMEVTRTGNQSVSLNNDLSFLFGQSANATSYYDGVRDCFLETTGIAAGIALVAALTAEVIDKGLVKKLIKKAVKKIGGRVLGGIGLALMVIDFTICMTTSVESQH